MDPFEKYTGITLMECPQHTWILKDAANAEYVGGSGMEACTLRRLGECIDSESQYCNSGGDFICPPGFELTSGTKTNTFNDCVACPAGSYCANRQKTACPAGYQCPAYSTDPKRNPAQPGQYVSLPGTPLTQCAKG